LIKGLDLVQVVIGLRDDLTETADIIIDPLLKKSDRYFVGTKYLLTSILEKVSLGDVAPLLRISPELLGKEVKHNEAGTELLNIAKLYQKLEWDSEFFGINIAYISCLRLTPNIERHVKNFIRREKIGMLTYQCNCHDNKSVVTAEKNGYSFVDIRLTFEQFLKDKGPIGGRDGYSIKKGVPQDIGVLKKLAGNIYKLSRYYYDSNFDRAKVTEFYSNWIEKAVLGTFDDYVYVLCHLDKPIGFCSIKEHRGNTARIGLFGMSSDYAGKGLSQYLLNSSLQKLKQNGIDYVEVVTQGRNYGALRLYQRCGFVTKATELWYHKWFC